jgi:hypothetical protein
MDRQQSSGGQVGANYVRNTELLSLLKQAEKSQTDRMQRKLREPAMPRTLPPPCTPSRATQRAAQEDGMTPAKTTNPSLSIIPDEEEMRTDIVPLTADEVEWFDEVVKRNGHSDISRVFSRLVDQANSEPPEAKKKLFLVIRCRRCSAGAKGGVKTDHSVEFSIKQWQWLENVRERCRHASVGKTLRIIVDFYMPLCKDDASFEQSILRIGAATKTGRHKDAIDNVDPQRALAIRGPFQSSPKARGDNVELAPTEDKAASGVFANSDGPAAP